MTGIATDARSAARSKSMCTYAKDANVRSANNSYIRGQVVVVLSVQRIVTSGKKLRGLGADVQRTTQPAFVYDMYHPVYGRLEAF